MGGRARGWAGQKGLMETPTRAMFVGRSRAVTCPGRLALALGAAGVTHQNRHLHDIGLLQELRVHLWPRLKQHAGVPGVVGAQLLWHECQACNVKARGSLSTCRARGSQINSAHLTRPGQG